MEQVGTVVTLFCIGILVSDTRVKKAILSLKCYKLNRMGTMLNNAEGEKQTKAFAVQPVSENAKEAIVDASGALVGSQCD